MKKLVCMFLATLLIVTCMAPTAYAGILRRKSADTLYHGLQADFYLVSSTASGHPFTTHKGTYVDHFIAFADMDVILADRAGQDDWAGVIWTGILVPNETAEYTFHSYSDNGFRLYVDDMDTRLIDYWNKDLWDHEQNSAPIYLEAGKAYNFKAEFFDAVGGAHVWLRWSKNGDLTTKTIVPASVFYLPEGFEGPILGELDLSDAQLNLDEGLGGTITINGAQLSGAKVYMGNSNGVIQRELQIVEGSDAQITVAVPTSLNPGTYTIVVENNNIQNYSTQYFQALHDVHDTERPEHPRPDWKRDQWMSLNGYWKFEFDADESGKVDKWYEDKDFSMRINVPFPWESPYSLIENTRHRGNVWYEKDVTLDSSWNGSQIFLKFGAVDAITEVYVNGQSVGAHNGGYTQFEFDITDYVQAGTNKITVWVDDKASYGDNSYPALVGKQGHNAPCGYTHTSGIWQTVYLEGRSQTYFDYAHANNDVDNAQVQFDVKITSDTAKIVDVRYNFQSVLWDDEIEANIATGSMIYETQTGISLNAGENVISLPAINIDNQKLWNWNSPNLYEGTVEILAGGTVLDQVETYFGQKKYSTEIYEDRDYEYIYVNGEPTFLSGLLDQGFWEEGVYTAPSEEALKYDISRMKDYGFNMIRKHLKIEDPLQYVWADRLGMFVWQDMPHATLMNVLTATDNNGNTYVTDDTTAGRYIYEEALYAMLERDYNHPSVMAVMLFNETWGINWNGRASAVDGLTTERWVQDLYDQVKERNPQLLVEDMSPCNNDHIQPTDLNTYHFYTQGYRNSKNTVNSRHNNTYPGSGNNFRGNYRQQGEPWLNSEYGGVAAYDKDYDVSWCFKHQTDIQRQYEKLNGFVYTEPYDIEYERNGILTYDRRDKVYGYDEMAYGGDMLFSHLTQPEYVGIDINNALEMAPGSEYTAPAVALNWSSVDYTGEGLLMKWRFDITDVFGNNLTTDIGGEFEIDYKPYTKETADITFTLPTFKCLGTVTVWIEDTEGNLIAKNYVNIIADDKEIAQAEVLEEEGTYILRSNSGTQTFTGSGALEYTFSVPADFEVSQLDGIRLLVEASSRKDETVNFGIDNSANSQTTEGAERPSDMTVTINGYEIDTVYLPDNPRDIRGLLTLNPGLNGGSSAGNYGYLVNLNITGDILETLQQEIDETGILTVTYSVAGDAANRNGLRVYGGSDGRYLVAPTVILNPADVRAAGSVEIDGGNYAVETTLTSGESLSLRDGGYTLALSGETMSLFSDSATLGEASVGSGNVDVRVRLFDDHIQVYAGNQPVPVIDVYEFSGFTGGVSVSADALLTVSPESYGSGVVMNSPEPQSQVEYVDSFTVQVSDSGTVSGSTFGTRYTLRTGGSSNGTWDGSNADSNLKVDAHTGNKAIINSIPEDTKDMIVEADITLTSERENGNGNLGFIFRGSNYINGNADGAYGYYVGIGNGYIQLGKMAHNWTQIAKVNAPITWNETHRLKAVVVGSRIRIYLDDNEQPYIDVYDSTHTQGSVALRGYQAAGIYDNLVVSTAPRYDTDFSNGSIAEWSTPVGSWSASGGQLTGSGLALVGDYGWSDYEATAVVELGDDAAGLMIRGAVDLGKTAGYKVVADPTDGTVKVIRVQTGIESLMDEVDAGIEEGGEYEITVRMVNNTLRVYLDGDSEAVLTVSDDSMIKTGSAGVVADSEAIYSYFAVKDKFIYEEDFNDGALDGWEIISGNMSVADNTLTISRVANGDKLVDGYATWSDFTLQADIQLDYNPSGKSNGGFVFRGNSFTSGQDNLRGYVVGVNYNPSSNPQEGEHTGIEMGDIHYGWRVIANTVKDEFNYEPEKWYNLEVHTEGENITVLVDGEEIYSVDDYAYQYGQFGLRVFNSGMRVRNLKVIPAGEELTPSKTIRERLGELIEEAEALTEADYTEETWQKLTDALAEAKTAYDNDDASDSELKKAYDNLKGAVDELELVSAYDALQKLIQEADELDEALYTQETWAVLSEALTEAKAVAPEDEEAVIKAAYDKLKNAIDALEEKEPSQVDKSRLNDLIAQAEALEEEDYTPESWDALEDALTEAKGVFENHEANQEEVDLAADALQEAIDALVEIGEPGGKVESVKINLGSLSTMGKGESQQLTFTVNPEDAEYDEVIWTSSTPTILEVDEDGWVTAIKSGSAIITVSVDGVTHKVTIRVTA